MKIQLRPEHIETIKKLTQLYLADLLKPKWQEMIKIHNDHRQDFGPMLSKESLEKMTEQEFKILYKKTWASIIWNNKDWVIDNNILKPNGGFENIRRNFVELLYGEGDMESRLDNFKNNVEGIGFSTISEILNFVFPLQYGLFNAKTKFVLQYMNIDLIPDKYLKYGIQNGSQYIECLKVLTAIKDEFSKNGFKNPNFIDLDAFFWYIFEKKPLSQRKVETIENQLYLEEVIPVSESDETKRIKSEREDEKEIQESKRIQALLAKIGETWGYKVWIPFPDREQVKRYWNPNEGTLIDKLPSSYTENQLKTVGFIDVLWVDKGNMSIKRAFEVEATTSIYSGLLRMSDLLALFPDTNIKLHIVAPSNRKDKVFREILRPTFEQIGQRGLRSMCTFISFENVKKLANDENLEYYMNPKILDEKYAESVVMYTG